MDFVKMHGAGNDFVMLDFVAAHETCLDLASTARRVCDRHKGIGADGLIIVSRGTGAPFRMEMLNPDGTDGGMCGNGVRCAARLLIEAGHHDMSPIELEVGARNVRIEPLAIDRYRVDMGPAVLSRGEIGVKGDPGARFVGEPIHLSFAGVSACWSGTAVSMGNPHLVLLCDDPYEIPLEEVGPRLEHLELFPNRVNVHFAVVLSRGHIQMRTWERGAGITLACGSGACSVGVAGFLNSLSERNVEIDLPGGRLAIHYQEDGSVLMEGPAVTVFAGSF